MVGAEETRAEAAAEPFLTFDDMVSVSPVMDQVSKETRVLETAFKRAPGDPNLTEKLAACARRLIATNEMAKDRVRRHLVLRSLSDLIFRHASSLRGDAAKDGIVPIKMLIAGGHGEAMSGMVHDFFIRPDFFGNGTVPNFELLDGTLNGLDAEYAAVTLSRDRWCVEKIAPGILAGRAADAKLFNIVTRHCPAALRPGLLLDVCDSSIAQAPMPAASEVSGAWMEEMLELLGFDIDWHRRNGSYPSMTGVCVVLRFAALRLEWMATSEADASASPDEYLGYWMSGYKMPEVVLAAAAEACARACNAEPSFLPMVVSIAFYPMVMHANPAFARTLVRDLNGSARALVEPVLRAYEEVDENPLSEKSIGHLVAMERGLIAKLKQQT
ncbi:Hypothetical Protein FCC1311_106192 [Hondaea fermentalgiana]|uniref:Uncharacterized protein n=1 Tax=Hondaea fermentalgiana TaxID=2315210 RepID=A0A2R5GV03_9STRA|nr:Hypothetical Protein FCC1311_106192 [Hondaea fermentalgiana]|eukprot:GBG34395.1 Hypothetical Protein FCC1311_106192 [Hondaea fermentalgiana]